MSSPLSEIRLAKRPSPGEAVSLDCFTKVEVNPINNNNSSSSPNQTLLQVRPLYFSVDPYLRSQFDKSTGVDYVKPFEIGKPISSMAVGIVEKIEVNGQGQDEGGGGLQTIVIDEASSNKTLKVKEGCLVLSEGVSGWPWRSKLLFADEKSRTENNNNIENGLHLLPLSDLRSLAEQPIPQELASHCLGIFGATGLTAYFGILRESGLFVENQQQQQNQTPKVVVISTAAGGTGIIASQLVKKKCSPFHHVIGISGSDAKGQKLLELGICDKVINYKNVKSQETAVEDLRAMIREASGGKSVDMYFDSVGGDISKAIHHEMSPNGTIVLCGQVSTYNSASKNPEQEYPPPLSAEEKEILFEKLKVKRERYLVLKYASEFEKAIGDLLQWVTVEKCIMPIETVFKPLGFDNLPEAFIEMMKGGNFGKMVVKC